MSETVTTSALRALERSFGILTSVEREALQIVQASGPKPVDGAKVRLPAEPGKIAFSIEFGTAELRWNATWSLAEQAIAEVKRKVAWRKAWSRTVAREIIVSIIDRNEHLTERGQVVIAVAIWLMFTSDVGPLLKALASSGELDHAGYVITRTDEQGGRNFRLIAGRRGD